MLSVIFLIRTGVNVSRANGLKRKKNKLAHMYAAAPSLFFGNETALWGMDVTTCTIIALALVAVCVVCLVCMLVSGHKRKLAEEAYEDAQAESDKKRRDDDMKMMFMMMNGGRSGDGKGPQIVQTVDVREIVEETIKNLMPAMQQQLLASGMGGNDTGARLIEQQNRLIDNLLIDKKASDETLIGQEIPDELEEDEEDWDSESDEEVVEEVTPADVISPDGAVSENPATVKTTRTVRLPANFRMRLKMSSDKNREAYVELKNMFNARRGVAFRVSGCVEKIRYRGEIVAAIGVSTNHLKLWLAHDPAAHDVARYHHRDVSDRPRYAAVPMLMRVGSDRALARAKELLNELFEKFGIESKRRYEPKGLQELAYTLKHNALLRDKEKKQLLREVIHVHDADALTDEDAAHVIEKRETERLETENFATVKLDKIDECFADGQRVTLDALKRKGIVGAECNGYCVTGGNRLTKPLIVVANEFSTVAVKMIVLTGGRAILLEQPFRPKFS